MDKCDSCERDVLPFAAVSRAVQQTLAHAPRHDSTLLRNAFYHESKQSNGLHSSVSAKSDGLEQLVYGADEEQLNLVPLAAPQYYYYKKPNCFAIAAYSGLRGAVVGSVFGGAMGLSTSVQSGFRGSTVLTHASQSALRNAAAFSSWTALFGFTRCSFTRIRGRDDMVNAAAAGFFTGAVLSLISVRGHWRYNQASILSNAASSSMIAVLFSALNQF